MLGPIRGVARLFWLASAGTIFQDHALKGYEVKGGYGMVIWIVLILATVMVVATWEPVGRILGLSHGKEPSMSGQERTIKIKMKGDHNIGYIEKLKINQAPEPKIHMRKVEDNRDAGDGLYVTKYEVAVDAPYGLARLCAITRGKFLDNIAWTADGFAVVSAGKLPDGSGLVECIANVSKAMTLTVVTTEPEDVQVEFEGERQ